MQLRELFATFGLDFDSSGVEKAKTGIEKVKAAITSFGAAIASAAIVQGIWNFALGMANLADDVGDLSARTGVATGSLQRIGAALGTVGVDLTNTAKLLETMNLKMTNPRGRQAIEAMGVSVTDTAGQLRSSEQVFLDVTDHVSGLATEAERTAALVSVFGQRGRALGALLGGGSSQIREMVEAMGGLEGITQEVIEGSGELETQMTVLDFATTSLKNELMKQLLPIILEVVTAVLKLSKGFYDAVKKSNAIKAAFILLGGAMVYWGWSVAAAWWAAVAPMLPLVAGIALAVLIVDDLITMFEGGDSVIGDFIDSMFGVGATTRFVDDCKIAWEALGEELSEAWDKAGQLATDWAEWVFSMQASASASLTAIGTFFTNLWNRVSQTATDIKTTWSEIWNDPMAAAQEFWDWIVGFIEEKISAIGGSMSNMLHSITGGRLGSASTSGSAGNGGTTPRSVSAPRVGGQAPTNVTTNSVSAPIIIQGNPDAQARRQLQAAVNEAIDQRNRQAAAALVPQPE